MGYTLDAAVQSITQYSQYPEHLAAVMRLQSIAEDNPEGLRAASARIRDAFYVYDAGYNYGRA
ncbi:MAG: hypothetical protein HOY79_28920 [Streptomyces sp.]|nr:hypothetical protein [Streptomyces sp.]